MMYLFRFFIVSIFSIVSFTLPYQANACEKCSRHLKTSTISSSLDSEKSPFTVSLQYRPRFEYNQNKDFTADTSNEFVSQRARIGVTWNFNEYIFSMIQFQDVRTWGEEFVVTGDNTINDFSANAIDLHQGFVQLGCKHWYAKVGRQEILFDNQRLVGNADWLQQGRALDSIVFGFQRDMYHFRLFFSKISDTGYKLDKDFHGSHLNLSVSPALNLSVLFIQNSDYAKQMKKNTTGLYAKGEINSIFYEGEGYYQFGTSGANDIQALLLAGSVGYKIPMSLKPSIAIFTDYLSGDNDTSDTKEKVFDTLYATNHKFYGFMDFYLNIPKHTNGLGLVDSGIKLTLTPTEKGTINIHAHNFMYAQDNASAENALGQEIDLVYDCKMNQATTVSFGASAFMPGDVYKNQNKDELETFVYTSINFQL